MQIWTTNIKAYDNAIPAGRSDVARFRFRVLPATGKTAALTLRARVNYRRFNQEYTSYVLTRQKKEMSVPIVKMVEAAIHLNATSPHLSHAAHRTGNAGTITASRCWNKLNMARRPKLFAKRRNLILPMFRCS